MTLDTIDTAIGPADVLHRLLLAVECQDAVLQRRVSGSIRIGRELPAGCCHAATTRPGRART